MYNAWRATAERARLYSFTTPNFCTVEARSDYTLCASDYTPCNRRVLVIGLHTLLHKNDYTALRRLCNGCVALCNCYMLSTHQTIVLTYVLHIRQAARVLVPGNELADWLAGRGARGERAMHGRRRGEMDATMARTTTRGGAGRRQAPPTPSFLLGGQRWGGGGEG